MLVKSVMLNHGIVLDFLHLLIYNYDLFNFHCFTDDHKVRTKYVKYDAFSLHNHYINLL